MPHDHVTNGVAPVEGCPICELLVQGSKNAEEKIPDGRMPPWIWEPEK